VPQITICSIYTAFRLPSDAPQGQWLNETVTAASGFCHFVSDIGYSIGIGLVNKNSRRKGAQMPKSNWFFLISATLLVASLVVRALGVDLI